MPPRSHELNERLRAEATDRILESALGLFAEKGFHGTSMSQIAKRARISKGLTYHYFRTKDDLLERVIEKRLSEVLDILKGVETECSPSRRLEQLVEQSLRHVQENASLYRLYFTLFLQPGASKAVRNAAKKLHPRMIEAYQLQHSLFEQLGYQRPEIEVTLFRSTLQGIIVEFVMEPESYPLEAVRSRLVERYS